MKVHSFFIALSGLLFLSLAGNSQTVPEPPPPPPVAIEQSADSVIFEKVETEASFPGGETAWRSYLEKNLNPSVPVNKGVKAGTYTVWIQFVVDKNGNVSDIKALSNHGYGMEAEVIRIIRKSPPWKPAMQFGRMVKAYRKQPVTFMIEEEKKKRKNRDN